MNQTTTGPPFYVPLSCSSLSLFFFLRFLTKRKHESTHVFTFPLSYITMNENSFFVIIHIAVTRHYLSRSVLNLSEDFYRGISIKLGKSQASNERERK